MVLKTYRDKQVAGERGAAFKYPTMSVEDLRALPMGRLGASDSALFMWATCPQLGVAIPLMEHWGWSYRTVAFVWEKTTVNGRLHWGMGSYTRANAELVLLGVRGHPKRADAGIHQILRAQVRDHSQKPDEAYRAIEDLMVDPRRVDVFARQSRFGWTCLGDAIDGRDIRSVLASWRDEGADDRQLALV